MTIKETSIKFNVSEETVKNWCEKSLLRGLRKNKTGEYDIPKSVKSPYTGSRSKGDAIYTSIVKGTIEGLDVTAALYGISKNEFDKYIQQLKAAGVIDSYIDENTNIEYLCKTLTSSEFSKLRSNKIKQTLKSLLPEGNIEGNINIGLNIGK